MTKTDPSVAVEAVLLPCPFCGSKDAQSHMDSDREWYVFCGDCGCETSRSSASELVAISAWNTRPANEEGKRIAAQADDIEKHFKAALPGIWTDFLDANPDDLTSPEDLPDHALMTGEQFEKFAMLALDEAKDFTASSFPPTQHLLEAMTALDEEIEAEHPGWMTGEPIAPSVHIKVEEADRSDWPQKSAEEISEIIQEAYLSGGIRAAGDQNITLNTLKDAANDYMMEVGPLVMESDPPTPAISEQGGEAGQGNIVVDGSEYVPLEAYQEAMSGWKAANLAKDEGCDDERPRLLSEQFKALPDNVRRYIMMLETDCDPSGTIRSEMIQRDHAELLEARLIEVKGCFDAAICEGLNEVLAETSDERLKDIVERRLLYAFDAACNPTPASPDRGDEVERLREALAWYGEQARLARLIHSGGDAGRHALADDGGKRARSALTVGEGK